MGIQAGAVEGDNTMTTRAQQVVYYYKSGMNLWASPICDTAIDDAKNYIKSEGYTSDHVRLVKTPTQIQVWVR